MTPCAREEIGRCTDTSMPTAHRTKTVGLRPRSTRLERSEDSGRALRWVSQDRIRGSRSSSALVRVPAAEGDRKAVTMDQTRSQGTSVLMEVSNAMVKLHKEQFGRGPTNARTYFAGP